MPFSSKYLIGEIYRAEKTCKMLKMLAGLLAIEQRLKHFNRLPNYLSITDSVGSFLG